MVLAELPMMPSILFGIVFGLLLSLYALPYLLMIPTALAASKERRRIDAYVPIVGEGPSRSEEAESSEENGPENPYSAPKAPAGKPKLNAFLGMQCRAAERAGFEFLGAFRDGKGERYKLRYDLWLSPDREIIAILGAGRIGPIPTWGTTLVSHVGGGRTLTTVDRTAAETDLSGLSDWRSAKDASFDNLVEAHRRWIAEERAEVIPFSEDDPLGDYRALRAARVDRLRDLGYARYLDDRGDAWQYTPKGALVFAGASRKKAVQEARLNFEARRLAARSGSAAALARPEPTPWLDRASTLCFFLLIGGVVLSFTQRVPVNSPQFALRFGLFAVGLGGTIAIRSVRSARERRRAAGP